MKGVAAWMTAVAVGGFVAGIASGLAWPVIADELRSDDNLDPDEQFARRLHEQLVLTPKQLALVRAILRDKRDAALRMLRTSDLQRWPPELRSQYETEMRRADRLIFEILDAKQRAHYDELIKGK